MTGSTNNTQEYLTPSFETFMQAYPLDGGLPANAPPEDRLFARVHALLQRVFDDGRVGQCFRIGLRELVRELLGPAASNEAVLFCEISIINQCLAVNFFKERRSFLLGRERLSKQAVEHLARHITMFSPGGLRAVREAMPAAMQSPGITVMSHHSQAPV